MRLKPGLQHSRCQFRVHVTGRGETWSDVAYMLNPQVTEATWKYVGKQMPGSKIIPEHLVARTLGGEQSLGKGVMRCRWKCPHV